MKLSRSIARRNRCEERADRVPNG